MCTYVHSNVVLQYNVHMYILYMVYNRLVHTSSMCVHSVHTDVRAYTLGLKQYAYL